MLVYGTLCWLALAAHVGVVSSAASASTIYMEYTVDREIFDANSFRGLNFRVKLFSTMDDQVLV